jgi:hypothetical protein
MRKEGTYQERYTRSGLVKPQRKPWKMWPDGFRDRTGTNVNYAGSAMAELLEALDED